MAEDIKMIWDEVLSEGDINFTNNDFELDGGLQTAVLVSLFTDTRADEDDTLDDSTDKRGWWADQTTANEDKIGSKLWLLARSKTTQNNINLAKEYIKEALEWMIEDGLVTDINVTTERQGNVLAFKIELLKSDGNVVAMRFDDLWENEINV